VSASVAEEHSIVDPAIHAWQISVIEKLNPYMRWQDDAPIMSTVPRQW
jgi:hypothetical protein